MKRLLVLFFSALIMLSLSACSSGGSEETTSIIELGVTQNQLIEQLGYSDEYYSEYKGDLTYYDIKIFDQYCKYATFRFESNELTSVTIYYPSGADSDTIIKALEKTYGKSEDYSTDKSYYWSYNNIHINAMVTDTVGVLICKSED